MAEGGTGVTSVDQLVVWSVAIVAVVGALALIVRGLSKITRLLSEFVEDWRGESPRPGHPGRPGVMERIDGAEHRLDSVELRLDGAERQVGRLMLDGQVGEGGEQGGLLRSSPGFG